MPVELRTQVLTQVCNGLLKDHAHYTHIDTEAIDGGGLHPEYWNEYVLRFCELQRVSAEFRHELLAVWAAISTFSLRQIHLDYDSVFTSCHGPKKHCQPHTTDILGRNQCITRLAWAIYDRIRTWLASFGGLGTLVRSIQISIESGYGGASIDDRRVAMLAQELIRVEIVHADLRLELVLYTRSREFHDVEVRKRMPFLQKLSVTRGDPDWICEANEAMKGNLVIRRDEDRSVKWVALSEANEVERYRIQNEQTHARSTNKYYGLSWAWFERAYVRRAPGNHSHGVTNTRDDGLIC